MASEIQPAPVASPTRQRVAAWIALALALVFPLMVVYNAMTILTWQSRNGEPLEFASVYSGFAYMLGIGCYFLWPLPIVAIFLAGMVLNDSKGRNRVAWAAVILGALPRCSPSRAPSCRRCLSRAVRSRRLLRRAQASDDEPQPPLEAFDAASAGFRAIHCSTAKNSVGMEMS